MKIKKLKKTEMFMMCYEVRIVDSFGICLGKFDDLDAALDFYKNEPTGLFAEIWVDTLFVKSFSNVSAFKDYVLSQKGLKNFTKKVIPEKGVKVIEKDTLETGVITGKCDSPPNSWWIQWDSDGKELWLPEEEFTISPVQETVKTENKLVDNNPKTLAALKKSRLSDVPPVSLFALGAAMSDGADKYGRFNYRDTSATASVFYDAILRHLTDWYSGEDYADDSKVHHLGHIMASCAILLDTMRNGNFNDDRDTRQPESISRNPQHWKKLND
jgi:hypothetical protein